MNSNLLWSDQVPEREGQKSSINDIAISPDGTRVIVAVGNRVLLYNADSGELIDSLRGHKDTVYSVDFSHDGTRFASGGADNVVVIWKITGQGMLKFTHTTAVQKVKYNPSVIQLASCSEADFGLWTPEQKQVLKEKVPSRITAAAWSTDGAHIALGMLNGMVSIRSQQAEEILRFERKDPVWCLLFLTGTNSPSASSKSSAPPPVASSGKSLDTDVLVVGCWDKTLSFYKFQSSTAKPYQNDKQLSFYPTAISLAGNAKSSYLVLTGSNKTVSIFSREGIKLADILKRDSWIWSSGSSLTADRLVVGSDFGGIDLLQIRFDAVHALHRDRYAYRENLTEVIVHNFSNDHKVRIKCRDLVQRIAIYKNKLAVLLTDKVTVYESNPEELSEMHFRSRKEGKLILRSTETSVSDKDSSGVAGMLRGNMSQLNSSILGMICESMLLTANHVLFANKNILELYSFDGVRQRLWRFESNTRYLKVDSGPEGKEGIIVGLTNGLVLKIFVDNGFPIQLTRRSQAIISADLSLEKNKLACVDEHNILTVTDLRTQDVVFTQTGVNSVCCNSEVDDMLAYTTNKSIFVVSGVGTTVGESEKQSSAISDPQEQYINGHVLAYQSQRIYCLYRNTLTQLDVPQSLNLIRALDSNNFKAAYRIACLGATEADWRILAMRSLRANQLVIAKNSFARLKDTKYLSFIEILEKSVQSTPIISHEPGRLGKDPEGVSKPSRSRAQAAAAAVSATPSNVSSGISPHQHPLEPAWNAELLAYEGHHHEAAKLFSRIGKVDEAIRLFTDLRRWQDAKLFAQNAGRQELVSSLTNQQARWLQEVNDWRGASEIYLNLGQHMQAAKIIIDAATQSGAVGSGKSVEKQGDGNQSLQSGGGVLNASTSGGGIETQWQSALIEVVRSVPIEKVDVLNYCGDIFVASGEDILARETFTKAGDISKLMSLYARRSMWAEAAKLADENEGKFDVSIFLPYAEWLIAQDRFEEAIEAYKKSCRSDLGIRVLEELTQNAVDECRFKDAGYFYWLLAQECGNEIGKSVATDQDLDSLSKDDQALLRAQQQHQHKADLYYAYSSIHSYITDPFTSQSSDMLFQVSRFIINSLGASMELVPKSISKSATLYTLAKQAMKLQAYKLARLAYDRLSKLQLPSSKQQEEVELDMLIIQAKPVRDNAELLPVCYRCSSTNPLLNPFTNKFARGDVCTNCGHAFVRSFINFDILPLVEFIPDPSISDEEAVELIRQGATVGNNKGGKKPKDDDDDDHETKNDGWREGKEGEADTLSFGGNDRGGRFEMEGEETDLFMKCLNLTLESQNGVYLPITVDARTLASLKRNEVFICRPPPSTSLGPTKPKRATFYRNMLPEIPIALSQACHRFFHLEDFEFSFLTNKCCPYSKVKVIGDYSTL